MSRPTVKLDAKRAKPAPGVAKPTPAAEAGRL
jgi:hypothetical protein